MTAFSFDRFDGHIKALLLLKAAYMKERDPKRSCQIYRAGHRLVMILTIRAPLRNDAAGLRGFFNNHERDSTCAYLLQLWAGKDPWWRPIE